MKCCYFLKIYIISIYPPRHYIDLQAVNEFKKTKIKGILRSVGRFAHAVYVFPIFWKNEILKVPQNYFVV